MTRSYRYRLLPTQAQSVILYDWLRLTRELYNAALQERRDAWKKQRISVSVFDQMKQLADVRSERGDVKGIPISILRGALYRLDCAFSAFFNRCKISGRSGFPRFKSKHRWNSLLIEDIGRHSPIVAGGARVKIPLLGKIKFRATNDRPVLGTPKNIHITNNLGKWFVTFACVNVPTKPLPKTGATVGVDLGLTHFAATSDGELFENPRPLATARIAIERAQRIVNKRDRNSRRRRAAVHTLARRHAHVAGIRREQHIALARSLVTRYDVIYVEDLNVRGLVRGILAKAVSDAGWGKALKWIATKAEEAARENLRVSPIGSSKRCSRCGTEKESLLLSQRVFKCNACGNVENRDVNAAINIKRAGTLAQGAAPLRMGRRRSATCTSVTALLARQTASQVHSPLLGKVG